VTEPGALICRAGNTLFRTVGDEVILAEEGGSDFELLGGGAAAVWLALEEPMEEADLMARFTAGAGRDRRAIEEDVRAVLDQLVRRSALVRRSVDER
jgi:coenzyme PQQ synthesis protein D (PqqD)